MSEETIQRWNRKSSGISTQIRSSLPQREGHTEEEMYRDLSMEQLRELADKQLREQQGE
jgi:hypothetical protein